MMFAQPYNPDTPGLQHGKIAGEPDTVYHATDAVSHSRLEKFRYSPAEYKRIYIDGEKQAETDAMLFGRAFHTLTLQPRETFDEHFVIGPKLDGPKTRNPWKREWDAFKADCAASGRVGFDYATGRQMEAMRESIWSHRYASQLLEACETEVTWRGTDQTGITLQARTDLYSAAGCELTLEEPFIADVKTATVAEFHGFSRNYRTLGYYRQAAFYEEPVRVIGGETGRFLFIVAIKEPPYLVQVRPATRESVEKGRRENAQSFNAYRWCREHDLWPKGPEDMKPIDLQEWCYEVEETEHWAWLAEMAQAMDQEESTAAYIKEHGALPAPGRKMPEEVMA